MNYSIINRKSDRIPFTDLRREMDQLLNEFWVGPATRHLNELDSDWTPACDLDETQDHYLVSVEIAGIPKENVQVAFYDRQLMISGERHNERKKADQGQWYSERQYGKFQRTFTLPSGVDTDRAEAQYQDGILRICIPKSASARPKVVKVLSATEQGEGFFGKLLSHGVKKEKEKERERILPDIQSEAGKH